MGMDPRHKGEDNRRGKREKRTLAVQPKAQNRQWCHGAGKPGLCGCDWGTQSQSQKKSVSAMSGVNGGRGQDRTADPFDVNEVLSR